MNIAQSIGKGFRFFLMSMGVSTYPRRTLGQTDLKPKVGDDSQPVAAPLDPPTQLK